MHQRNKWIVSNLFSVYLSNKISRNRFRVGFVEKWFSVQSNFEIFVQIEVFFVGRHLIERRNVDLLSTLIVRREILHFDVVANFGLGCQWVFVSFDGVDQVWVFVQNDILVFKQLPSAVVDRYHTLLFVRQTKILDLRVNQISIYHFWLINNTNVLKS